MLNEASLEKQNSHGGQVYGFWFLTQSNHQIKV